MPACFGQVQPKKWTIRLFFFSYSGGGLQRFAVVCGGLHLSGFTAYRPKFWWWFAVIYGGLWLFAVVCGGLRWFVFFLHFDSD